jgi:alkylation response protein AidB-like acyl-CoA dehydrogenase
MDFSWTEEQSAFRNAVIKFAQKELNTGVMERDRQGEFSLENWSKCAKFGIQGLPIPENTADQGQMPSPP